MAHAERRPRNGPVSKILTIGEGRKLKKCEAIHFGMRKVLLGYDDVVNAQKKAVCHKRQAILDGKDPTESILKAIKLTAVLSWRQGRSPQGLLRPNPVIYEDYPKALLRGELSVRLKDRHFS